MEQPTETFFKSFYCIKRLTQFNNVKLSPTAKDIFLFMLSLHSSGLEIFPSHAYLADMLGVGRKAIILGISQLEKAGMIESTQRMDSSKVYRVLLTPDQIIKNEPLPSYKSDEEDSDYKLPAYEGIE
ncbi:hypothetical protein AU509_02980 [Lonsdalea britannica]|uniref:Helix-turn-helix domain-containing protein n=1 Tax=Lonsdalea britannica TaxID=1082704 RepID=A0AAD0SG88_9GAMM|nr:helix-turn-helix domain-containing protein [Lonsdalea britannica]AXW87269.1 helix-turn-helix domain-containing protein [Lonsdalea britannica]OSM99788.1 hypothetical protein AU509_02980 [Lonsdalea britannica]